MKGSRDEGSSELGERELELLRIATSAALNAGLDTMEMPPAMILELLELTEFGQIAGPAPVSMT